MRKNCEFITHLGLFLNSSVKKEIAVIQIIVRHKSPRHVFGNVTGEREEKEDVEAYLRSSPMLVVRLTIKVDAPVWGRAKAAPKPKARTLRPAPTERPDMKSRL